MHVVALVRLGQLGLAYLAPHNLRVVRDHFVDLVEPADLRAVGRAFRAVGGGLERARKSG